MESARMFSKAQLRKTQKLHPLFARGMKQQLRLVAVGERLRAFFDTKPKKPKKTSQREQERQAKAAMNLAEHELLKHELAVLDVRVDAHCEGQGARSALS